MEITFPASSVSIEGRYQTVGVSVTVIGSGREIAAQLDLDDRLHDLDAVDVVSEVGAAKLLEQIGEEEVRTWLLANSDPDDTLEHIGSDKIHEYLSHGEPDGNSPV
ncbi:hypothetical protein [Pseudomonas sp. Irchel 3A18]|uniref:hypothetical protein n=1 Tax=Pseudomonas sp. Irchel 3A18 TaxID=2008905 RepID=UPI000BA4932F|nr:hypothetical protein [Pseudomonas sp. Irchel 3A18]